MKNENKKGYLYLLQSLSNRTLFKIGVSKNIDQRLKALQNTSAGGIKLIYLFFVNDCYEEEALLKSRFNNLCINGEWFNLVTVAKNLYSYSILEAIGQMHIENIVYGKQYLEYFVKSIKDKGLQFKNEKYKEVREF